MIVVVIVAAAGVNLWGIDGDGVDEKEEMTTTMEQEMLELVLQLRH